MLPPPAPALLTESNILPVMRYYATLGTIALRNSLSQCLVLRDTRCVGPDYLLSCLRLLFPFNNWTWTLKELPDHHYLVVPPSIEWKDDIIRAGEIAFGGIVFTATIYDFRFFNSGTLLKEFWIRVFGYPQDLWRDTEMCQLARDLGGIFLESDTRSGIALRLKIGVPDKEVISGCRRLIFTDSKGISHSHLVQVQVETSELPPWGTTRLPVFDTGSIRDSSVSPHLSESHGKNLSLAHPTDIPGPSSRPPLNSLTMDLNLFPEEGFDFFNTNPPTLPVTNVFQAPPFPLTPIAPSTHSPLPDVTSPPIPDPLPIGSDIPLIEPMFERGMGNQIILSAATENPQPEPTLVPIQGVPQENPEPVLEPILVQEIPQAAVIQPVHQNETVLVPQPDMPAQDPPVQPRQIAQRAPPVPAAAGGDTEETRHSLRLKVKELTGGPSRRPRGGSTSGNNLIQKFPYINLSDHEIIELFEVSGLSLGPTLEEQLKVVAHLKTLSTARFSSACANLIPKRPSTPPVDLSDIILSINNESPNSAND